MDDGLIAECTTRFWRALDDAPFDTFVASTCESVRYVTGYQSMAKALHARHDTVVICKDHRAILVAPCGDLSGALGAGIAPENLVVYGTFYFESYGSGAPETRLSGRYETLAGALEEAFARMGTALSTVGIEETGLTPSGYAVVAHACGSATVSDGSQWMRSVRAVKTPREIARLAWAAHLAERGIREAFGQARAGWTEMDIASLIARSMSEGGGVPTQLSVQVGTRTALGDAYPTTRRWMPGDLLRIDVGCTVDGYWSDIARTGVLGEPSRWQMEAHKALLAGEQEEVGMIRPGVTCGEVFQTAVDGVREAGMVGYRRTHCGHGIGLEVYDQPLIEADSEEPLEEGTVLCLETPYYHVGRGGILIEDTVVVTDEGCTVFTTMDRELRCVEP